MARFLSLHTLFLLLFRPATESSDTVVFADNSVTPSKFVPAGDKVRMCRMCLLSSQSGEWPSCLCVCVLFRLREEETEENRNHPERFSSSTFRCYKYCTVHSDTHQCNWAKFHCTLIQLLATCMYVAGLVISYPIFLDCRWNIVKTRLSVS